VEYRSSSAGNTKQLLFKPCFTHIQDDREEFQLQTEDIM